MPLPLPLPDSFFTLVLPLYALAIIGLVLWCRRPSMEIPPRWQPDEGEELPELPERPQQRPYDWANRGPMCFSGPSRGEALLELDRLRHGG